MFFLTTCAIGISKLRDNCITVMGGVPIIIHVQQWLLNLPLCLGCSDVIPRACDRECDREYEKRLVVVSVGQVTIAAHVYTDIKINSAAPEGSCKLRV